ncbi:hypothetical protein O6H91_17G033200 [Diphasiastrum complanatum]|uniref:Uncharacterized protein n=2 Tax=Diphasiastrum complanatum TaxID=34168 RepID=A0ACC2B5I1_DIPCM|nr:hypothetical protein O6H91_17G033200 [Diphasiastrum complanatum]KAJ7525032.1 hypothetical protein O6H91_17G033200 [Diphasiastrum complanatum]
MAKCGEETQIEGHLIHLPFKQKKSRTKALLVEEQYNARVLTLNKPRGLNCIDLSMMLGLENLLEEWEKDDNVDFCILKAHGEAFSAGGDLRALYTHHNPPRLGKEACYRMYWIDYHVATYKKPIIVLWSGLVMGLGVGLSVACMFRVATEKAVFAMPEAALGFHTDASGSYFLPRLPGYLGEYLALTGARLNGIELKACGLATHFVPSKNLWKLEALLLALDNGRPDLIQSTLDNLSVIVKPHENSILNRMDVINKCFSKRSLEEIIAAVVAEKDKAGSQWLEHVYTSLIKSSPTGLKQTLRSIRDGRSKTLLECTKQEFRISWHAVESTISTDFLEGIRAIVIDKDKAPKWKPASLAEVTEDKIDLVFQPIGIEELQLPQEGIFPRWAGQYQPPIYHRL